MVYKSLVYKNMYHATTQRDLNKLNEIQFQKINYNFKTKIHSNLQKLNKKNCNKPKGYKVN